MLRRLSICCMMMLLLASAGCSSTQSAQRTMPPAPPAWMMQPAPDLLTPLSEIIGPSEVVSKSPESK